MLICNNVIDEIGRNRLLAVGKTIHQCGVAQDVDHARDTAAGGRNLVSGIEREHDSFGAGRLQTKGDIVGDLALAEGLQVEI